MALSDEETRCHLIPTSLMAEIIPTRSREKLKQSTCQESSRPKEGASCHPGLGGPATALGCGLIHKQKGPGRQISGIGKLDTVTDSEEPQSVRGGLNAKPGKLEKTSQLSRLILKL